jgi:hypothetical protein
MSHDMLHHAELKIFFEVLHKFEFIWIWNLVWIWIWKPYRKRNRKGIRKSREKEKGKQPSRPKSAQPGHVPAPPTGGPHLSAAVLPRACPPSLARCQVGPTCQRQFPSPVRSLSLSVSWAQIASRWAIAPRAPFFSLYAVGLPCQFRPLRARRGPARAHSRTSPDFSATTPAHTPSSLLRAPPVPYARPSPQFAQLHPLSRSTHAASHRRRPAHMFSAIQLAGDRSKPPWALPRGETPVPMPNFPCCAMCSAAAVRRARAVAGRFSPV